MSPWTAHTFEILAAVLAPPRCSACDDPVPMHVAFCRACASTVERAPPEGDARTPRGLRVGHAFVYGGAMARALARFKYEGRPDLGRPLGDLVVASIDRRAQHGLAGLAAALDPDAVVMPVPLHPLRLAERGFNQSALLARRIRHRLGLCLDTSTLLRARDTPRQTALDREARDRNVRGAFRIDRPYRIVGRRILLVDDVCTTGATLDACAEALERAGAAGVEAVVVARTPAPDAGMASAIAETNIQPRRKRAPAVAVKLNLP